MTDRLQKKCFLGSTLLHVTLCGVLVLGAAFSPKEPPSRSIELVALNVPVSDNPSQGGTPPPPAPKPSDPTPVEPPPVRPPEQVKVKPVVTPPVVKTPVAKPDDEKPKIEATSDRGEISVKPTPKPKPQHKIKLNLDKTVDLSASRKQREADEKKAEEQAEKDAIAAAKQRSSNLLKAVRSHGEKMASSVGSSAAASTVVDMPGQGGGAAFASYRDHVYSAYYNAWIAPEEVAGNPDVFVTIVVSRTGNIISAEITKSSGQSALDRSVDRALRKVLSLPPFPDGTRDTQRSFRIKFNLEDKQSLG